MRLLGLDPGLIATGWGVIDVDGNELSHVADGVGAAGLHLHRVGARAGQGGDEPRRAVIAVLSTAFNEVSNAF